ncbi:thioredoxin domain-containing protein [Rathayibacter sp. YIM 133350]|uniref:thioredoxin domain-containing protein n=1 Tax=Rathayibacter sp. YIM 133350 TaxID=3131992 RepID=UPI00307F69DD
MNRLAASASPYLLQHADNPVDWWPWGADAFAEARRRDVPVFISIGYATCHWCHVMARESFSDPVVAAYLNDNFVSIKVDREEHPDVDASYITAAGVFTRNLGWPLSIFATPAGLTFFAGTYFPPRPVGNTPEFLRVLGAVTDAWANRRDELTTQAEAIGQAIATASVRAGEGAGLPDVAALEAAGAMLAEQEDRQYGGFGDEPKFPVATVLGFLLELGGEGDALAARTLKGLGASGLRDSVEGGFFRYATRRDWTDPHYERMLYDNALLLEDYTAAWLADPGREWAGLVADGIARFLTGVLQLPSGGFASGQDSESVVDGARTEGGYYRLDEEARSRQKPPALDRKVLSGWNGLAIAALARAGFAFDRPDWLQAARRAADDLLERHVLDDRLVRASLDGRASDAVATLEDYGMLAGGLVALGTATGDVRYAEAARGLIDATLTESDDAGAFTMPGGADPVLVANGIALAADPSEGAYPSGISACADAAYRLYLLTGDRRYRDAAEAALAPLGQDALRVPLAFGGALATMRRLAAPVTQLVTVLSEVTPAHDPLVAASRRRTASVVTIVTDAQAQQWADAGFELLEARTSREGRAAAYLCEQFTCRLPVTEASAL